MTCRGYCKQYVIPGNRIRYGPGIGRCSKCLTYMKWAGRFCPCCGCMLRRSPHNTKGRKRSQLTKVYL